MADHLDDRLSALSDTPVPALLPATAVRARGEQRRRRQTAALGATAALVVAALGGVALAGGQEPQDALQVAAPPSASATAPPSPTAEPTAPTGEPTASPTAPSPPVFPDQAALEHGGSSTAVYLAVSYESDDPELQQAQAQAQAVGYRTGVGGVSCDQGAREALGLDPQRTYYAVALYFADGATAQQFVDAYEPGVVGVADVTTYCLD